MHGNTIALTFGITVEYVDSTVGALSPRPLSAITVSGKAEALVGTLPLSYTFSGGSSLGG